MYYNRALLGIEANFSTYPVMKLQELGYPNQYTRERDDTYTGQLRKSYGFRTDRQTRPRAIAGLVEVFSAHPRWFRDRELLGEMLTFVYNEDHRPEAMMGHHDDMVMSAAIAYAVRHQQRTSVEIAPPPKQEKLIDQLEKRNHRRRRR
jgi:phage terminase large subunit